MNSAIQQQVKVFLFSYHGIQMPTHSAQPINVRLNNSVVDSGATINVFMFRWFIYYYYQIHKDPSLCNANNN